MTRLRLGIVATLVVVSSAIVWVIEQQSKLREENRLLRQQIEELTPLQAENGHLSNLLAQANNAQPLPSAQLSELLRLRSEVGALHKQTNDLGKLENENRRLRTSLTTPKVGTQTALTRESLPKESWAFVGYADPESAFQSASWAMREGDARTFRAGLAPGGTAFTEMEGKSDEDLSTEIKGETGKVTAFMIIGKEAISEDTAILTVSAMGAEGLNEVTKFKLQRFSDGWKVDGRLKEPGTK
jgi:hypothetical protein